MSTISNNHFELNPVDDLINMTMPMTIPGDNNDHEEQPPDKEVNIDQEAEQEEDLVCML